MQIRCDIPVPNKIQRKISTKVKPGRPMKYPWPNMNVGDSIFFPDEPKGSISLPAVSCSVWGSSQSPSRKFAKRSIDGGVRIWRVK